MIELVSVFFFLVQLGNSLAVFFLKYSQTMNGVVQIYKHREIRNASHFVQYTDPIVQLDLVYSVFTFFVLSSTSQLIVTILYWNQNYVTAVTTRFIEYSLSASVMLVCIGVLSGINDLYSLMGLAAAMFATNSLGLAVHLAMRLTEESSAPSADSKAKLPPNPYSNILVLWIHGTAWITCITSYACVLWSFEDAMGASNFAAKDTVTMIVYAMAAAFLSFGLVQLLDVLYFLGGSTNSENYFVYMGLTYDILSVGAKSFLGWSIMMPILQGQW